MKTGPDAHRNKHSATAKDVYTPDSLEPSVLQDAAETLVGITGGKLPDSLTELVEATQPWAQGDHFKPDDPVLLDHVREKKAWEVFDSLHMLGEVTPIAGEYDSILVLGGKQGTNRRRVGFLKRYLDDSTVRLSDKGRITLLGGNRPLADDEIVDFKYALQQKVPGDTWVEHQKESDIASSFTEALGLRAAALDMGDLILSQMHLRVGLVPPSHDIISQYQFRGKYPVDLINSNPVERSLGGDPRHTTESTIAAVSLPEHARVLFVSSNPYIARTLMNARSVLSAKYPDTEIVGCGPAILPNADVQLCFGEFARLVYEIAKRQPTL